LGRLHRKLGADYAGPDDIPLSSRSELDDGLSVARGLHGRGAMHTRTGRTLITAQRHTTMNTMPFPDDSQEAPRGLLVALPEFRLNPLNGRTAPIAGVPHEGSVSHSGREWSPRASAHLAAT